MRTKKQRINKLLLNLLMLAVCLSAVLPIVWMLLSALRPSVEFFSIPPTWLPKQWSLINFSDLLLRTNFPTWIWNSILVTFGTIVLSTCLSTTAAYSLARFRLRGRKAFVMFSMMAYMLPTVLLVIPLYLIFARLALVDSLFGLTLSYVALTLPYSIWLLRAFFRAMPYGLEEAAAIDGAGNVRTLVSIVLPMSVPGIISTVVYTFSYVWNEYMFALVLMNSDKKMTFPVGLKSFITDLNVRWEFILTGGILVSVPAILVFMFTQKQLIQGYTAGAVKG